MINRSQSLKRIFPAFGLTLLASLALAGFAAGSASALSFKPANTSLTGAGGGVVWQAAGGPAYSCASSELSSMQSVGGTGGSINEPRLRGCKTVVLGFTVNCTTAGQPTGTILASKLNFSLVWLDAAKTKFGFKLTPQSGAFAEFNCGGTPVKWTGSVLGQITKPPLNTASTQALLSFTASGSTQTYQQIGGEGTQYHLSESRNGGAPAEVGLATETWITPTGGQLIEFTP